jgi:alkanesulfonate monooxygenase SsuD/methylene tetrahydromethanopterin reductase-like flavin-dependent oxidoreductase (luciferase family)
MRIGVIVPQGWTGEYASVRPADAWQRTVEIARRAEAAGADSLWLFDHMHTTPDPRDEPVFEAFTALTAIATATSRAGLGHIVSCAAYRNPGLHAKMLSTMDVISGGRMTAGIGAGWKRDEWEAYGYGFPSLRERQDRLEESLEILTRMLAPGIAHATFEGRLAAVQDAINLPKPLRGSMPIMVGGNGRERTWRIAARFADELNLDNLALEDMAGGLRDIASRCEEIGRDPSTLRVSVHLWWESLEAGGSRRDALARYAETGVDRAMILARSAAADPGEVERLLDDAEAAGCELVTEPPASASPAAA